jgi:hypothetical protein
VFSDTWGHNLYDNLPTGTPLDIFFGVGPTNFTLSGEPAFDIITITGTPVFNGPGGYCQYSGSGSGIFAGYPNSPVQLIDMRIFSDDTITGQYQATPSAYPGQPIIYSFTGVIIP